MESGKKIDPKENLPQGQSRDLAAQQAMALMVAKQVEAEEVMPGPGGNNNPHGIGGKSGKADCQPDCQPYNVRLTKQDYGNTQTYNLRRLKRDAPEHFERFQRGEYPSVRAKRLHKITKGQQ